MSVKEESVKSFALGTHTAAIAVNTSGITGAQPGVNMVGSAGCLYLAGRETLLKLREAIDFALGEADRAVGSC